MAAQQQQTCKIGNSTIIVHSDAFVDGFDNGFVVSPKEVDLSTDSAIYEFLVKNIADPSEAPTWNAGYIVGAIRGLLVGPVDAEEAPHIQLGTVTFRLNSSLFRGGFSTGWSNQEPRSATVLTARELLQYVAHRNPETGRYSFTEHELAVLEDVLGQLVGYLCAALFKGQEHATGPLEHSAILQEA